MNPQTRWLVIGLVVAVTGCRREEPAPEPPAPPEPEPGSEQVQACLREFEGIADGPRIKLCECVEARVQGGTTAPGRADYVACLVEGEVASYPVGARRAFVATCPKTFEGALGDDPQGVCTCAVEKLAAAVPFYRFVSGGNASDPDDPVTVAILDAFEGCGAPAQDEVNIISRPPAPGELEVDTPTPPATP